MHSVCFNMLKKSLAANLFTACVCLWTRSVLCVCISADKVYGFNMWPADSLGLMYPLSEAVSSIVLEKMNCLKNSSGDIKDLLFFPWCLKDNTAAALDAEDVLDGWCMCICVLNKSCSRFPEPTAVTEVAKQCHLCFYSISLMSPKLKNLYSHIFTHLSLLRVIIQTDTRKLPNN